MRMTTQGIAAFPQKTLAYLRQAREELNKVSWPSRETTIRYTGIVVVGSILVAAIIGAFDLILVRVLESLISLI